MENTQGSYAARHRFVLGFAAVAVFAAAAHAQTARQTPRHHTAIANTRLSEVLVLGSRETGVTVAESSVPVQLISAPALSEAAGNPSLVAALAQLVPAFTAQSFGNDMAGQTLQARLRGLSCNDVLVLVNGERRHTTANIEVDSGPYQGCAGTDLNFIPVAAISRIEVLNQGAAAQYGSGAIAGVINIILKKRASGGTLRGTYGGYMDGGGLTGDVSVNAGFAPLPHSYLNVTAEVHHHGSSNRSAIDERVINPSNLATYPDSNMLEVPGYPYLGAEEGDGQYDLKLFELNSGFSLPDGLHLYVFGTYGLKRAQSFQKYRLPSAVSYTDPASGAVTYPFPFGFVPLEASRETDDSVTAGLKGTGSGWHWDLSSTYGRDRFVAETLHSANAALYAATGHPTPLNYYDGDLQATQWTSNLDVDRDFAIGLAAPLNVAAGVQYRDDGYGIGAGMPISYLDGGAQGYPGFTPSDAGTHHRRTEALYVEVAARPVRPLKLDAAGRYEHYSDFGAATVGKLTGRYEVTRRFALRATVSSGFRAPTLAEEYYSSTNVTPTSAFVQLPPNSPGGRLLGLGNGLRPEHSVQYSLGLVWQPSSRVIGTLDVYRINITHRIVATGNLYGTLNGVAQPSAAAINAAIAANGNQLDPTVLQTGSTGVTMFANGIDTRTQGADLTFDLPEHYAFGRIDWSVGANFNQTAITRVPSSPAQLAGQTLYDATALSDLTTASPRDVINLGARWQVGKLSVDLTEQLYGPSSEWENDGGDNPANVPQYFKTTIATTAFTNLSLGYRLKRRLTLQVGAINLFDRYPNRYNRTLLAHYDTFKYGDTLGVFQYPMFAPFGINGGYYYGQATVRL
ncbi:MAG: TonB-dependent receptor plug domain-containing protein [Steroidobacteraceae bacterium]